MPKLHVYLPTHLNNRRGELPVNVTLSGLLAEGMQAFLDKQDAANAAAKKKPGNKAAA